jgi:LuxR family transcriptional regulator, maltose regulon positive regulatory protein
MVEQYPALLITKLHIPRLRVAHVARGHLLALLDASVERKLTLIAAAAGSGKTTLAADWCNGRTDVSWLSLDEGDNDPARFFSYLIAAIQTQHPTLGMELLAVLQSPQPPPIEHILPGLVNQLAVLPENLIVALDDYHVIDNRAIHTALTFLLDHLPQNAHFLLLTRTDPPLPLAKLRAKNNLLEIRAAELRFSPDETEHFLNHIMHLNLPAESIQALDTRTEGWIAGLQLAALAMQPLAGDTRAFIDHFTGSHRFILDYLMEEVLAHQPEAVRAFLLQTSILNRLNGDLCSTVTGAADGHAMLEHLERSNLFLIPLDQSRGWYRYHHLFADLLQARLQAEYPADLNALYQRAAAWHEHNGFPEAAVEYALAAGDFDGAANLILGAANRVSQRGEVTTLLDWYRAFPSEFVANQARLCLYFGMAFALNGRWDDAETLLSYVEGHEAESLPYESLLLAYLVASYRQDRAKLESVAQTAHLNPHPDATTKLVLGLLMGLRGEWRGASQLMAEAQAMSERAGEFGLALSALLHRCRFLVFAGDLRAAHDGCQMALERIQVVGGAALPMASLCHTSLGRIYIEWNDLEHAEQHLSQAIRLGELTGFVTGVVSSATMMLAEVNQGRGDAAGAIQFAQDALTLAQRYDPAPEVTALQTYQTRIFLAQGNISTAEDWLAKNEQTEPTLSMFYPPSIHIVTQARVLLGKRRYEAAVDLLTNLNANPHDLLSVEVLGTLALARAAGGDSVHALLALEQALTSGVEEHRIRVFLDLGQPMAKLLAQFVEAHPDHIFAQEILRIFPADSDESPILDPLSEREIDVLRLIAAGHTNDEIAARLVLAVSTVKWYINVIYGKLHVKSRAQAIVRAHELKLLV